MHHWPLTIVLLLGQSASGLAIDHVVLRRDGQQRRIDGKLVVNAADGGLLVVAPDGVLWSIQPEELVEHTTDETQFKPLTSVELAAQLADELPAGFDVHATNHYLICHYTSKAYAQWCGGLLERLYLAFTNYWSRRGFELREPEFPLVAVIFADRSGYAAFSQDELGATASSIIGYYSLRSNRVTMSDLTGIEALRRPGDRRGSAEQINEMLSRPAALRNVATVVHEATHQIAFNCGLQARYADIPLWVSEGIAVYFETPDLSSSRGWRNIGGVNHARLQRFRSYLARRPADSLSTLIVDDARFREAQRALDAYAEAWAWHYFLIRQRSKEYHDYMQMLAQKKPFLWDKPEVRLAAFRQAFGDDLAALDAEFLRFMKTKVN